MEILTEKQQIEKQAKAVFISWQIMDNNLSKMMNKLSNYRNRLFKSEGTERALMYEIGVLETATNQLYAYQSFLYKELERERLKSQENFEVAERLF
jgi:hypothetical protein